MSVLNMCTSVNTLEIVAILLLLINHSNALCEGRSHSKPNPSLGDLCLEGPSPNEGLLMVYYTDNFKPARWGTICGDAIDEAALETMCHQLGLGYDKSLDNKSVNHNSEIDPWFTKVRCEGKNTQNFLRCLFDPPPDNRNCPKVYLKCGPADRWNKVPETPYIGQVVLIHPKNTAPGHQVSFGLVLIYLHHDKWGTIFQNKTQPFTRNAADSICRQMGYTEADPNYITTVGNSNTTYDHSVLQGNAWLMSNNTRYCTVSSEPCFSCCFNKPTQLCSIDTCAFNDSLVLQCLFDLHKEGSLNSEGNKMSCQISDYNKPNICAGANSPSPVTIGVGSLSGLLLIIVAILGCVLGCCCYRNYCKPRPANPEQQRLLPNNNLDQRQN